ncbi:hypothetical protein DM02DRAFT_610959 [Periconia macrospinosa]|uniref:IEC3 subunit of the Ino80 complex, chromatin re-modelling-domain-containing protein n=1 Tax=Periconia macrospinosa TaxID=97972 RepID=A0A2V1E4L1_9PLEO|nr:hypothetical protein DM02DRAFT_610959 [Periconia macrospinosa]
MATEAAEVDALHEGQPDDRFDANPVAEPGADDQKPPVKRSWRRKYRKMRAKFEETMNASNQLIMDEWKAQALARRLQEQNDQILDVLLQLNEQVRIPAPLRYDLRTVAETDSTLPMDPEPIQERLHELRTLLTNGTITAEEYAQKADQLHSSHQIEPMMGLAHLEAAVPHSTTPPDPPVDGIDVTDTAPGYMSPNHEEEFLLSTDAALADQNYKPDSNELRPLRTVPVHPPPSEKDLTIRNPNSVYNWLRKNQPQVFLQDKDQVNPENVPEKLPARATNTGGRGKRQSAAHGTPAPKTDHEDDDAFVPETGTAASTAKSRKSKGGEDDGAYRPKGGSSRPSKRKREDGDTATKGGRKKNRQSTSTVS